MHAVGEARRPRRGDRQRAAVDAPEPPARLELRKVAPDRVERDAESHGELRGAQFAFDSEHAHDLAAPFLWEEFDEGHPCRITQKHAKPRKVCLRVVRRP